MDFILYSYVICPFSRKIRFILTERDYGYRAIETRVWERNKDFIGLNPANEVPVLVDGGNKIAVCDSFVIAEYLENIHRQFKHKNKDEAGYVPFLGYSIQEKAEIERLEMWFDKKFFQEVSKYILDEKAYNRFIHRNNSPNISKIKAGQANLETHLKYMEMLLTNREWLAGNTFSLADISGATQLSSLDYFGDVPWFKYPKVKNWYLTIKSKKGFQSILRDKVEGFKPVEHYAELDF